MADPEVHTEFRQPAIAPNPVAENRIHDCADAGAVDHEGREFPTFGRSASRDGCSGVHEDHLEQEERKGRRVIARSLEHETFSTQQANAFAASVESQFVVQTRIATHGNDAATAWATRIGNAASHECKS